MEDVKVAGISGAFVSRACCARASRNSGRRIIFLNVSLIRHRPTALKRRDWKTLKAARRFRLRSLNINNGADKMKKSRKRFWGNRRTKVVHDAKASSQQCGAEYVKPENLVRFATTEEAESNSFRKCKRCFKADVFIQPAIA